LRHPTRDEFSTPAESATFDARQTAGKRWKGKTGQGKLGGPNGRGREMALL